jgi:uncharacterized RDD family membrane protein YckC
MANFCHECAQRVAPTMRACPNCGTALVGVAPRPATATAPPPRADVGGYTPNLSGLHAAPRMPASTGATSAFGAPSTSGAFVPPVPPVSHGIPGIDLGTTPNASTSPYARAAVGSRLVAWLIDALLGIVVLVPGAVLAAAGYAANEDEGMMVMGGTVFLFGLVWAIWYAFTKDGGGGTGQSVGKRRVGLMVVHLPSNTPCTRAQSAIRALVAIVTNVVPAIGWLIEPVMVFIGEDGRRLGDRAAETQVIAAADYPAASAA